MTDDEIELMMPEFFQYLVELRDSGETNMWAAPTFLHRNFNRLTYEQSKKIFIKWIKSFDGTVA